jgi:uncharacterized membrane protein
MRRKIILITEQLLLGLQLFTLFLLLFSNQLELPFWLQPAGRLHPALLHFPITLLLLWALMHWFAGKQERESKQIYLSIKQLLLLFGSLTAGITVVAGIFLSRESTYSPDEIYRHKWTGAALFFLSGMLYAAGKLKWTGHRIFEISPFLLVAVVLATGHFGGEITHGEQYILSPLLSQKEEKEIPFDSLQVYNDLVRPMLEKKCISCHNQQKMKGELSLADTLAILKGGKTGELFVPGQTASSLLLQRIHLPLEDEHHMPPQGKIQLTAEEMYILEGWVKHHSNFIQRLNTLPSDDTMVIWASARFKNAADPALRFKPADANVLAKLNTSYCSVLPSDRETNALEARLFSQENYTAKQLEELRPISEQLVAISLAKLPVKDDDLKKLSAFEQLRRLDLSFTNITTAGLRHLKTLQHLEKLTLAGTAVSFQAIQDFLNATTKLKTIGIWNTGLTNNEVQRLEKTFPRINFLKGFDVQASETLKLNPPQLKNNSQVFKDSIRIDLKHPIKGTTIRYTTNGKNPDSLSSAIYSHSLVVKATTLLTTQSFKSGWYASDITSFGFYKNSFIPDSVNIVTPLNAVHQAEGNSTFFNGRLGSLGANNPAWANFWAGVRKNEMTVDCFFKKAVVISSFGLRFMIEESTGIFPPGSVEVWGGKDMNQLKLLGKIKPAIPQKGAAPSIEYAETRFKKMEISHLKIIANPYVNKKDRRLLLVDEFFIN